MTAVLIRGTSCSRMYLMKLPRNLAYFLGALLIIPMREIKIQSCSIQQMTFGVIKREVLH